MSAVHAINTE